MIVAGRERRGFGIVPPHYEGRQHFTEGREEIQHAFEAAGLEARLSWLAPGTPTRIS